MRLEHLDYNGLALLAVPQWLEAGFVHGFLNGIDSFSVVDESPARTRFLEAVGASRLWAPRQTHSNTCVKFDNPIQAVERVEADALVVNSSIRDGSRPKTAFVIQTADCVPLIVRGRLHGGLIHAGWRGLANAIIRQTLDVFPSATPLEVAIGPCARGELYEVGDEVIAAIGDSAVSRPTGAQKHLLDTSLTAENQVKSARRDALIANCGICSMGDLSYHSHRRATLNDAPTAALRNLTFMVA